MNKKVLVLDSQQLTDFQKCARRYYHGFIENLEVPVKSAPLQKGSAIADALYAFYNSKIQKKNFDECLAAGRQVITDFPMDFKCKDLFDERLALLNSYLEYCTFYRNEEFVPFACENEAGFSKVLYEDDEHYFVYEGKPDATGFANWKDATAKKDLFWMDHKSTSGFSNLHTHSNQFLGYSWATDSLIGVINYVGLQKSLKPKDKFHRELIKFSAEDIQDWVDTTVKWYFRILKTKEAAEQNGYVEYEKNRASCDTKYSFCNFAKLCDTQSLIKIDQIKRLEYKVREQVWKAWR